MTDIQKVILKAELIQQGLSEIKALEIIELLSDKPENVQLAFYYRCMGETQKSIADILHLSAGRICQILKNTKNYADILKIC